MNEIERSTPDPRAELVAGLRALADFFERHPDMPIPGCPPQFTHVVLHEDDPTGLAEVHQIAKVLAVEATSRNGHTYARQQFRGLKYEAYYITCDRMAEHDAKQSYSRNVQVDGPSVLDGEIVEPTRALPATSSSANTIALLGVTS